MRTSKLILFVFCLGLFTTRCGGGKEGPDAMTAMQKNKVVRIATDAVNLPFEFGSGTGVQGFDVDVGNEVSKDLGFEPKWVKSPFERLFDILSKGEVELVISAVSITPERKKELAFSEPYFESGNTIARRRDNEKVKDLASLSGKKVGVQSSSTGHRFMESRSSTLVQFPTLDDALGALNRTEVEAVVGDEPILTYSIYKSFPNLITLGTRITEEQYGVVLRKNERELLSKVNDTIARLKKSGELDVLKKKWFQNVMEDAAREREELRKKDAMREGPKTVTFNFIKTSGAFNMERLDGYQLSLIGSSGSFSSTPILTNGPRGSCRFTAAVPPGDYRLNMQIFRLNTTITIPKSAGSSVTFDMRIGSTIDIVQR